MKKDILNVLLLCDYQPYNAATIVDHINAFFYYSRHDMYVYAGIVQNGGNIPDDLELERFDCIIVHYSLTLAIDAYVSPLSKYRLKKFKGLKAIFIQDEYRFVDRTVEMLSEIGFHIVFTCVPDSAVEKVYPRSRLPGMKKINVLTGYVPFQLTTESIRPLRKRRYDVGYRGRKYPFWHGRLGLEKWEIAEKFKKQARMAGFKVNISYREEDRLYCSDWIEFLKSCKAVLGVESGASVFDLSGRISANVEVYTELLKNEREKDGVSYEEVRDKYFKERQDEIPLEQISSRCFEAIATKTMLILYEGEYSGILHPWIHYVPLKKDHSNFVEIADVLRDNKRIAEIIATTYSDIVVNESYSYKKFIKGIDEILYDDVRSDMYARAEAYEKKAFYEKWPFYYTPYPHGLVPGRKEIVLEKAREIMPRRIKRFIRGVASVFR